MLLMYVFLLHPFWWLLGLDQVVMVVCPIAFLFDAALRRRLAYGSLWLTLTFCGILLTTLVSGVVAFSEVRAEFYFPLYIYRTTCFLGGLATFLLVAGTCRSMQDIDHVAKCIVWTVFFSVGATAVALALSNFGPSVYRTPLNWVIPESLSQFGTVRVWLERPIIGHGELFGSSLLRSFGLFLYSNMFAFALETAIPLSVYLAAKNRKYWFVALVLLVGLFSTLSRGGLLCLTGGALCAAIFARKTRLAPLIFGATVVGALLLLHYVGYENILTPQKVMHQTTNLIVDARENAVEGRKIIYEETLRRAIEKPWFGWGTTRKFSKYPNWPYIGSHSTYLYWLMSAGIFGTVWFILFFIGVSWRVLGLDRSDIGRLDKNLWRFAVCGAWIVSAHAAHMIILNIQGDLYVLNLTMATWGLMWAVRKVWSQQIAAGVTKT